MPERSCVVRGKFKCPASDCRTGFASTLGPGRHSFNSRLETSSLIGLWRRTSELQLRGFQNINVRDTSTRCFPLAQIDEVVHDVTNSTRYSGGSLLR